MEENVETKIIEIQRRKTLGTMEELIELKRECNIMHTFGKLDLYNPQTIGALQLIAKQLGLSFDTQEFLVPFFSDRLKIGIFYKTIPVGKPVEEDLGDPLGDFSQTVQYAREVDVAYLADGLHGKFDFSREADKIADKIREYVK